MPPESTERVARLRPDDSHCRRRILHELRSWTNRTTNKLASAIRAHETELLGGALQAISALEGADVSFARLRQEIAVAAFASWVVARVTCGSLDFRLTRHKISDRAWERTWPQAGRTSYSKATHRSGARFAASLGSGRLHKNGLRPLLFIGNVHRAPKITVRIDGCNVNHAVATTDVFATARFLSE
jgi:hypothetical protein